MPTGATLVGHGGGAGGTLHLRFTGSGTCGANKVMAGGGKGADSDTNSGPGGGGGGGRVFFQAQGLATCAPVAPAALGGMQPTVHNGAQPTATSLVDYAGTVTVLDSGFVDVIALPTFASPPGLDSWTNNPLLKGKTQHGFSEVLFYTVGGASAPFTYTPLNTRTASDSLKEFVYPYAPASSNNTPFRLVAQAGYMGAYSDLTPELRFNFDNVPPSTTLTPDTVPLVSRFTSAKFDMTSSEPNGTFQCALDNLGVVGDGAFELCTPSKTFNSLTTGDYRVTAYAVDRAGNQDPYPKSYTWRVDLTQPNTVITAGPVASPPGNPTNSKVAHFTFTGGTTYQCSLDGVPAVACGPSQTYTALAEGTHTLSVTAYSESGVADPSPATRTWAVDTVAPDTSFFNPPESPNNATTVTIEYRSPDATATFQCSLNGIDFTSMPCNGTGSGSRTFSGLVSGTRQFHVRAVDPAGNIDPSPISHTWVVDIDPPASIVITAPSAGLVNTSRPTIVGTTEPGVRVAVTVTPSDPGPPQTLNAVAGPSGAWSVIPAVLSDGSYTLSAVATDAAENTRQSAPVSITVDTLPPSRPVLAASIQGRYFTTMPISLSGMLESTAGLTPNTRVTVYVDDSVVLGPTPVDAQGGWSVSFTPSPLQDGFHWVRAMTTDAAGNVSPFSATLTFHVDLSDPTVPTIDSPGPYLTTRYPTLSGTAEVGTSLQIYFGPTPDPVTVSVSPNGRWSYLRTTPLNEGPNTVFVRSTDAAARVTDSAPVSFIVDVTKPETTIIEAPPPRDGNTTVLFRLGRPEALTYECRHIYETEDEAPGQPEDDEQAFTPCELPPPGPGVDASYIQKSNLIDGTQTLLIRAVDQAGNRDDSPASHTWSISTGPVDTDILSGPDGVGGPISSKTAVFRLWSNKGLIPFECKLDTASTFTPCPRNPEEPPDTARYEGLAEGNHTLSVRAVFALEPDTTPKSRSWTVDTVKPQPPVVTGPRSDRPTNLRKPTIQGQTLEPGLVTISIDDVQVGTVEIEGVTWLFTPTVELSSGPHVIKATVSDRAGNVSDSSPPYTIQVDADAPEVTILTGPTGPTGWLTTASFTFTFNASELVERYECALDGAAEFEACVSPYSGSVSGSNENHTMLIRAKDIAGNFSEVKSWDWKVDTTTPNTTIEFGEMKTLTNSPEATFRFSSNESSVTYTCSFNGSPFESCNASGYSRTGLGSADEESMEYTLQVKAKDPAGNEDPTPDKFTWQVDLKAPVPPVLSVPRANDILSVRTPTFQGDAEAESTVSIQENGVEIGTVQADASGDWRFVPRTELDYGSHTVTLVAKDKAGNASMPSSLVNFVLDPSLEIDARGGGLSCASAGGGGGVSLVLLALG
ncbi:hypothetical protein HUW62_35705, partial [Myxococcus sp. AM011]|uniref:Ig-like domain-containing protein n=1 Tax=Myxococcus sp. AM011 TaxID=2745200 RepID=UPI00180218DD|nr:hypothetical protein [Myxococcus sp. AM011]